MTLSIAFYPQCCDAIGYLDNGHRCVSGDCYDDLRPIGASLWFSVPGRLGLPDEVVIVLHWLLLLVSVVLSVFAVHRLLVVEIGKPISGAIIIISCLSSVAHVLVFWPVMNISLSDAPAGLIGLIAIWLLLINTISSHRQYWLILVAGLLLGCAAWIRAAYLYPLLGSYLILAVVTIVRAKKGSVVFALSTFMIPLIVQFGSTYIKYEKFSYLSPSSTSHLVQAQLAHSAAGYETILPGKGYSWTATCDVKAGISTILQTGDMYDLLCLLIHRGNYYFGSYWHVTYHESAPPPRIWSRYLLLVSFLSLFCLSYVLILLSKKFGDEAVFIALFLLLYVGQAMLIAPEQRFMVLPHILMLMSLAGIILGMLYKYHSTE